MNIIARTNQYIHVGDIIKTDGDGADRFLPRYIEGVVGRVGKNFFWLYHNDPRHIGEQGENDNPEAYGKSYVWCIGKNSPAKFQLIGHYNESSTSSPRKGEVGCEQKAEKACDEPCKEEPKPCRVSITKIKLSLSKEEPSADTSNKPMNFLKSISNELKKLLPGQTKTELEGGLRNEQLQLTREGRFALLEALSQTESGKVALLEKAQDNIDEAKKAKKDKEDNQ